VSRECIVCRSVENRGSRRSNITQQRACDVNVHDGPQRTAYQLAYTELTQTRFASLEDCLDALLAAGMVTLELSRASVWLFEGDGAQIHCLRSSESNGHPPMHGKRLQRSSCPGYFDALHSELVIDAGDAEADPRTCELVDSYLRPFGVRALLDAPIRIFGNQVGVLCLEGDEVREWNVPDRSFSAGLGALVGLALEHAELLRAREQMRRSQEFDLDTGLPNAHHFERALGLMLSGGHPAPGWVVRLELSQYPALRASLSNTAMRELYRQVAERLRLHVPGLTEIAHAGDSEFCLFSDLDDSTALLHAIRSSFAEPIALEGQSLLLAPLCGLRRIDQDAVGPVSEWMRDAETAMHQARDGGGEAVVHSAQLSLERQQAHALEQAIRRGVQAQEFFLLVQPMIDLSNGRLVGLEALIRWRQHDGSIVLPDVFLQVLLDTGLMLQVGRRLLTQALGEVAQLQRALGRDDLGLSFNLAAPELMQPGLIDLIRQQMQVQGFPRGQLAIELTESAVIADEAGIARILDDLRAIGCRVHLDDFGTGYSSLNHMRQLPFDAIKIDRSFLRGALHSESDRRLIGMLVTLSREMGRECIAEGIADAEHLHLAGVLHAQIGQGFMIAEPLPIASITTHWLQEFEARCRGYVADAQRLN
jgi:diguanylate cyclase